MDAGVKILKKADRALIENNRLLGNLYGVDVHGARGRAVRATSSKAARKAA